VGTSIGKPETIQQRDEPEEHGLLVIAFPAGRPGESEAQDAKGENFPVGGLAGL
jgi:hypothetical protein